MAASLSFCFLYDDAAFCINEYVIPITVLARDVVITVAVARLLRDLIARHSLQYDGGFEIIADIRRIQR
jgi:hypothetical protein